MKCFFQFHNVPKQANIDVSSMNNIHTIILKERIGSMVKAAVQTWGIPLVSYL